MEGQQNRISYIFFKCLNKIESLSYTISIKNTLNDHNIPYTERVDAGSGWMQFITLLFVSGRGSYGLNNDRKQTYSVYVDEDRYEQAVKLISRLSDGIIGK